MISVENKSPLESLCHALPLSSLMFCKNFVRSIRLKCVFGSNVLYVTRFMYHADMRAMNA